MTNDGRQAGTSGNRLDVIRVSCTHTPPSANAAAVLLEDSNGNLLYHDDFSTTRWQHLGQVEAQHPTHGGFRDSEFWVGSKRGYTTSTRVVQRISARRPMKELTVSVQGHVDSKSLGGHLDLGVAPRGAAIRWKASTDEQQRGVHSALTLTVPRAEIGELQDFDVHIVLRSTSGVESGSKACARLSSLSVRAK